MRTCIYSIMLLFMGCFVASAQAGPQNVEDKMQNRTIVGWIEKARILPEDIVMHAKIDTGADNSSINALNKEEFSKDGKKWIRFSLTNREGKTVTLERPIVRIAKIKRRKSKTRLLRPVVRLGMCVCGVYREAEVNLADRKRFKYQLLIGRSFMRDKLLVDPSVKYTREPDCREAGKK